MRDAVVSDIVHEMERVTNDTLAQEPEKNKVEVNEVAASPPSLAQLYAMFHPIQDRLFMQPARCE